MLSGIRFNCEIQDGKFVIQGVDLDTLFPEKKTEKKSASPSEETSLAVPFGLCQVRNAVVTCIWKGKEYRVPMDMEIVTKNSAFQNPDSPDSGHTQLAISSFLYPLGEKVSCDAIVHLREKKIELSFSSESFYLAKLVEFEGLMTELSVWGEADLQGEIHLGSEPMGVTSANASCLFRDSGLSWKGLTVRASRGFGEKQRPCRIDVEGQGEQWRLQVSSVAFDASSGDVSGPDSSDASIPVTVSNMDCLVKTKAEALEVSGRLDVLVEPFVKKGGGYEIPTPLHFQRDVFPRSSKKTGSGS